VTEGTREEVLLGQDMSDFLDLSLAQLDEFDRGQI